MTHMEQNQKQSDFMIKNLRDNTSSNSNSAYMIKMNP